jgi:hypothetical protein
MASYRIAWGYVLVQGMWDEGSKTQSAVHMQSR